MRFEQPIYLLLIIWVPILVLLYRLYIRWKKKMAQRIGEDALIQQLTASYAPSRFQLKFFVLLAALVFMVIGLSNWQQMASIQGVSRKGIDIILALDVSNSMLTEDVQPNRLERAKILIDALMKKRKDDRMGLLLFAGHAYLQMPLSADFAALSMYVQSASPMAVPTQGTVLVEALQSSRSAFDENDRKYKAVILISDGENHESEAVERAKTLKDAGIVLYTIGVGTTNGQVLTDPETKQPKLDKNGQPVVSKLNEQLLAELAQQNGGAYFFLTDISSLVKKLSEEMDGLEKKEIKDRSLDQYTSYFPWFIGVGLMLLIIEFLLSERKKGQ